MRIAVISDTHVPDKFEALSKRLLQSLQGVDLILHCGDISEPEVLKVLQTIAPVEAVAGNHDIHRFGDSLARKKVVKLKGYKIGMIHGDEYEDIHVNRSGLMEMLRCIVVEPFLYGDPLDIIIFGHCHQPILESVRAEFYPARKKHLKTKKSVLLFNPGMCIRNRHLSSIGFITLNENDFNIELKVFTQ